MAVLFRVPTGVSQLACDLFECLNYYIVKRKLLTLRSSLDRIRLYHTPVVVSLGRLRMRADRKVAYLEPARVQELQRRVCIRAWINCCEAIWRQK
jgi:hypothetical protein